MPSPLDLFLPPVREWFRTALGEPTMPQQLGWPAIAAGQSTLILAPTGSGKTLAAFLACLDALWRQPALPTGIQVLYISPLKALNNDIYRNLQVPLQGVQAVAERMGVSLPTLEVAVRTGDTPAAERQRLLRKPPHILITTPESLHLLLTAQARERLTNVRFCIVDEIHALCPNKRGVFLSLLLERLEELNPHGFVRIGLSATQKPLDEVARFLGGQTSGLPRPVTIIDAGLRKDIDLQVVSPVKQFGPQPEKSIWPSIYRLLNDEIGKHRSTIVFANSRRGVERITANLNELAAAQVADDTTLARAHHGSVSLEMRQATEQALKEGRLKAVVATASLELGIDMGAVDLVCQIESPGTVARGLQRVGRAGHLVGQRSKGRLIPKTLPDLLNQAVLAAEMLAGNVEAIRVPQNCLDVLAQQVVAMTAMQSWDVNELFAVIRRSYAYANLTPQVFETVLEMVSGRYQWREDETPRAFLRALEPRVSWDRTNNRLHALPGSQRLALVNGGTIPDTGQYAVYTTRRLRIGELDEEFIYERRVGDVFVLGTNAWRLEEIQADHVLVSPAEGAPAMVPFWRGEQSGRSYELGLAQGRFLRSLLSADNAPASRRLDAGGEHTAGINPAARTALLDADALNNVRHYVQRQFARTGSLPTDQTTCVEASRDQLGDWQVIVLTPLGSRFHFSLKLALERVLTERLGYRPQCLHHDDGILIRLSDCDEPILDVFAGITPENLQDLILQELADSALFALRFRQNAARALLFPRVAAGKRAPLWLQRLRGKDLLQVAKRHADFPILTETFRECLQDHLDLPRLQQFIADILNGKNVVHTCRLDAPSPFAAALLFAFNAAYMYEGDGADAVGSDTYASLDRNLLDQIVAQDRPLLDERAIFQVERRLRGIGQPPRSPAETAEWLRRLGDAAASDLEGPVAGFLAELAADGRVTKIQLPQVAEGERWVLAEEAAVYEQAFGPDASHASAEKILRRFLETHALVSLADILRRYPLEERWATEKLGEWSSSGRVVPVRPVLETEPLQWSAPENLDQLQRSTLAFLRREVVTCPTAQFVDFVFRWQGMAFPPLPGTPGRGAGGEGSSRPGQAPLTPDPSPRSTGQRGEIVRTASPRSTGERGEIVAILEQLHGVYLPASLWERIILPARLGTYQPRWLDDLIASGEWTWTGHAGHENEVAFLRRDALGNFRSPAADAVELDDFDNRVLDVLNRRGAQFVSDLAQQTSLPPSVVRGSLWKLLQHGFVTNDHFDVMRTRRPANAEAQDVNAMALRASRRPARSSGRRPVSVSEGRWSLVAWGQPETETQAVFAAGRLLDRYGIVSRELASLDPRMPPWRVLYEVLSRMELAGEVRRGYFVEGLSGAQFALPDAVSKLQELHTPSTAAAPVILVNSMDPANLYGPLELPDWAGSVARRAANWLAFRAGRPILVAEQHGSRINTSPTATREELAAAVALLPRILQANGVEMRHKLSVSEWNSGPVTSSNGRELLEAVGFVSDYRHMTLYAIP